MTLERLARALYETDDSEHVDAWEDQSAQVIGHYERFALRLLARSELLILPADTARTGWAQLHDEWWRGSHKRAEQGDVPVIVLPDPRNKAERGRNKAERGTDE